MTKKRIKPKVFTLKEQREIISYIKKHSAYRIMKFRKENGGGWTIAILRDDTFFGMIHPRSFLEMVVRGDNSVSKKAPSFEAVARRLDKKLLDLQKGKAVS